MNLESITVCAGSVPPEALAFVTHKVMIVACTCTVAIFIKGVKLVHPPPPPS